MPSSRNSSWRSMTIWVGLIVVAASVLCLSVAEVVSTSRLSASSAGVILTAIFVSVLLSRYEPKIAWADIQVSFKWIFAFWGVMWLGISGGVVIAAAASIAHRGIFSSNRKRLASDAAIDILSTFFSAIAFYLSISYFENAGRLEVAKLSVPYAVILATCVMVVTQFAQSRAMAYILSGTDHGPLYRPTVRNLFLRPAITSVVSLLATIAFFVAFNHFGIEFGLVLVPVAILGDLSYKIHAARLEQKTKQLKESSRIHLATVEALATAIDARDQVGVGHVRRTQIYAVGLGNILGLGEDEINALRTGALLHDIGKLAVPDHILSKPGRLTPAEMEKIKTHALVGASILEKVGFPYPVVPTVKYHHEFWDGSGYPEGLQGPNIPLTARILSIADAYDTLRIARPYRNAVPREEACSFLRTRAGAQFDPRLVDVFLRNLKIFETEVQAQKLVYESDLDAVSVSEYTIDAGASPSYVEQIKRANREVFALYSLARDFGSELDLEEIFPLFTQKVREFIPFDTAAVYLLDDNDELATAAYVDGLNKTYLTGKVVKAGEGPTGYVLKERKPTEFNDPGVDFTVSHRELENVYQAMASVPLIAEDKLLGVISLYSSEKSRYQDEDLRLLETVSRIAADAISKSLEHAVTENYALTDPMTGLPNARSLEIHFDKEMKRAQRNEGSFQLLVLDLDGFKNVNDTYGHKVGDRMLKEIGSIMKSQLREYDFLSRYGGDEFVAIVPDTDNTDVVELARRIEEAVNEFSLQVSENEIACVGVSVGTACYPIHGETFDQIINSADKAMYLTKGFHRKRAAAEGGERMVRPVVTTMPEELAEFATVKGVTKEGLILEVDETHIVTSSAVN